MQRRFGLGGIALGLLVVSGCTNPIDWVRNGFKVGPNYQTPAAAVSGHWIDAEDRRIHQQSVDLSKWWTVFNDATLNRLVSCAYHQNLSLKEAACRVLQARAQLAIARGEFFPQLQQLNGSYNRIATTGNAVGRYFDQWNLSFNLAWELDLWGRIRRGIASAEDVLEASQADYDGVLTTLEADVASNYVTLRTAQAQIACVEENIKLQKQVLDYIEKRYVQGFRQTRLDVDQTRATLAQTMADKPALEIIARQAANQLCILLGMPAADLERQLGAGPIPSIPPDVVLNVPIPAELLRRRPDIRRIERLTAAQAEQIGIAEANFYPIFAINGNAGVRAQELSQLFTSESFNGNLGPSFQWNILNYGRILNNVRLQDARFQELVAAYQNQVLRANAEVEDGLIAYLRSTERARFLGQSVRDAQSAVRIATLQVEAGTADINRWAVIAQDLVRQQLLYSQVQGAVAQGLVQTYRALGGGWEVRPEVPEPAVPVPARSEKEDPGIFAPLPKPQAREFPPEQPKPPGEAPPPAGLQQPAPALQPAGNPPGGPEALPPTPPLPGQSAPPAPPGAPPKAEAAPPQAGVPPPLAPEATAVPPAFPATEPAARPLPPVATESFKR